MNKSRLKVNAVVAIVFITYSIIAFLLPFERNAVFWISYLFSAISIVIQLYVVKVSFGGANSAKSKFYGFPILRIGIVYMLLQVVVSIAFMVWAKALPLWLPLVVYILFLAVAAIGMIAADTVREEIERQDVQIKANVSCMTELRSAVYALPGKCESEEIRGKLQELADEFKYSDPVSSQALKGVEENLKRLVEQLQSSVLNSAEDEISDLCKKVSVELGERNRLCKLNKGK